MTALQVKQGLGDTTTGKLAGQTGISEEHFSTQLSTILLQVVDKHTPNGQIAKDDIMSEGMELIQGLLR